VSFGATRGKAIRMLEHYSLIRLNAKKAALDRLDQSAKRPLKATK